MHGSLSCQGATSNLTFIGQQEVVKSPFFCAPKVNVDSSIQQSYNDKQGGVKVGTALSVVSKPTIKMPQYTTEQVVAFGGIQDEALRGVRSSGRLRAQPNADVTQMERAMLIAKKRGETPVIGKSPSKLTSIISFADDHIVQSAVSLGVSLGNSHLECIKSVRLIKDVELQRTLTMLKNSDYVEGSRDTAACLAVTRASVLCDDLEEDEHLDDDSHVPVVITKEKKIRKKKIYDNNNVRRSKRVRVKNTKFQ
jgi:hypothetical protein